MIILFYLFLSASESCITCPELLMIPKLEKEISCVLRDNMTKYDWRGEFLWTTSLKERESYSYGSMKFCFTTGKYVNICSYKTNLSIFVSGVFYFLENDCQKSLYDNLFVYMNCVRKKENIENLKQVLEEIKK